MKGIKMLDLYGQYARIKDEVDEAIFNTINTSSYINGPTVEQFTNALQSFLQVKHVIPCGNGTDAIQIALMALGIEKGAEIIIPSFSFIAPAEVVSLLGFQPVFADVDSKTFNICPKSIKRLITTKTKAIIAVHLFGQCAAMEEIVDLARQHNLYVIEDNAQSIGAKCLYNGSYRMAGTIGDIGTTSFFPSKNLGCMGDGGALFTNNDALATTAGKIANHGQKIKYNHELLGINSRLDSIQAAVLNIKLKYLNDYILHRQKVAAVYNTAFKDLPFITIPYCTDQSSHVYNQYTIQVPESVRNKLLEELKLKNIPTMIYYPLPLHLQKVFSNVEITVPLSASSQLCNNVISLPIHTELTEQEALFISSELKEIAVRLTK